MSYNTEKWLCIGLIAVLLWMLVTGTKVHTGGDENYTSTRSRNLSVNIAPSLFGNPSISVDQDGVSTSGDKETITTIFPKETISTICPDCGREIVIRP